MSKLLDNCNGDFAVAQEDSREIVPEETSRFLRLLFSPDDNLCLRYIETWIDQGKKQSWVRHRSWPLRDDMVTPEGWAYLQDKAEARFLNQFFGVCPRAGVEHFDLACQVRTIRCLWADLDHCTADEARQRSKDAGLPPPTIIVCSGNGVHLYWLLDGPVVITDAFPGPIYKNGKRYFLDAEHHQPCDPRKLLSATARNVQNVVNGLSRKIGGDHTHDLARLLRLPGTLNRKDQRNGIAPTRCYIVEMDGDRRHPFYLFQPFAVAAEPPEPPQDQPEIYLVDISSSKLMTELTAAQQEHFNRLLADCAADGVPDRSSRDFRLLKYAVDCGLDREEVWSMVEDISKFGERGHSYFDSTWDAAVRHTGEDRRSIADILEAKAQVEAKSVDPQRNGQAMKDVPTSPQPKRDRRGYKPAELATLPDAEWQIENHFPTNSLLCLVGPSGVGKSFLALDYAFCLATGKPYLDTYDLKPGPVVYIAAEGQAGLRKRQAAWMKHYGVVELPGNLIFVPYPFNFQEESEVLDLMQVAEADLGMVPSFIVVDTLARNFGGGNENDASDMNTFVRCLDLLRNTYRCTVATVHHTGKDETRGARGHTALVAACDTIITLEASTPGQGRGCLVRCTKQKDFEPFEAYILTQHVVPVGQDRHGNDVTSLVLVGQEQWTTRFQLLPKAVKELLRTLFSVYKAEAFGYNQGWKASGYKSKDTFNNHMKKLQGKTFVVHRDGLYKLNPAACGLLLTEL